MDTAKPASAAPEVMSKPILLKDVTLGRHPLATGKATHPFARFKGKAPAAGAVVEFTLANGVTYRGEIAEAIEDGGEVIAEFTDHLIPQNAD